MYSGFEVVKTTHGRKRAIFMTIIFLRGCNFKLEIKVGNVKIIWSLREYFVLYAAGTFYLVTNFL